MTSGGREDVGGEGPNCQNNAQDHPFECSTAFSSSRPKRDGNYLTGKKLAFKFNTYIFEYWPLPPYIHLASTHVMNTPGPSPFVAGLPLPCIIVNANGTMTTTKNVN